MDRIARQDFEYSHEYSNLLAKESPVVYSLYLTHDYNIAGFVASLGVDIKVDPPLASVLLVQFSEDNSTKVKSVKVTYNDDIIKMKGCTLD